MKAGSGDGDAAPQGIQLACVSGVISLQNMNDTQYCSEFTALCYMFMLQYKTIPNCLNNIYFLHLEYISM